MGSPTSRVHVRFIVIIYSWIGTGAMQVFMYSDADPDDISERYSCINMLARDCGDHHSLVPNVTSACTFTAN